jgi:thiol-disulfide isomerase/thioredoxin
MIVRYVPWEDECSPDHKKAAGDLPFIAAGSLNAEARGLIQAALGSAVEPAQLVILGRGRDGALELAAADAWRPIVRFGAKGFPWTDAAVAAAERAEAARVDALRGAVARLGHLKVGGQSWLQRGAGAAAGREEVDAVADGNEMVGLYFSASWCGPCQGFTPELRRVYDELRAGGKRFEVVLVSTDRDPESFDEYFAKMPWLALPYDRRELATDLNRLYEVNGIPTLVLVSPKDGAVVTADGTDAVGYGAEAWPFDPASLAKGAAEAEARARRQQAAALAAEAEALAAMEAAPGPKAVVRRWRGPAGSAVIDGAARIVAVQGFTTVAVPGCVVPAGGRGYYEVEVTECQSIAQVGWATAALGRCDEGTGEGVGDGPGSWGADGVRVVRRPSPPARQTTRA